MKTILQEKATKHSNNAIWKSNLFLCLKQWKFTQRKQQWIKSGRDSRVGPDKKISSCFCLRKSPSWAFLVTRPNPILHFAPFLSTHFFPCLNSIFKNGSFLSVVALVSVTLLDSNPRPSAEKRSNLAPTPSSSLARTTTFELPECQERRGAKTQSVFFEKASPAEGRRRLHKNTGFQPPFLLNIAGHRPAMFSRKAG